MATQNTTSANNGEWLSGFSEIANTALQGYNAYTTAQQVKQQQNLQAQYNQNMGALQIAQQNSILAKANLLIWGVLAAVFVIVLIVVKKRR